MFRPLFREFEPSTVARLSRQSYHLLFNGGSHCRLVTTHEAISCHIISSPARWPRCLCSTAARRSDWQTASPTARMDIKRNEMKQGNGVTSRVIPHNNRMKTGWHRGLPLSLSLSPSLPLSPGSAPPPCPGSGRYGTAGPQ